jgi:hypothetical protein
MPLNLVPVIKRFLSDVGLFSKVVVKRPLRSYQLAPAKAIVESVLSRRGDTFAVVMSRQAGKNELSAQLEAYLMNLFQQVRGASIVKAAPTYKPQTINSKMRLQDCLDNPWNQDLLHGDEGYIVRLGRCRVFFFSAQPGANVVGATASVLLECDEAQDVDADKWSKDLAPMASSTNATTVFYGTIWTSRTLLAQVVRDLRRREAVDGRQRVFLVPWEQVAAEVPAYGEYVRKEMGRLGPDHPIIRTQYKLEEIDEAGRLFSAERVARMRGTHARRRTPHPCPSPDNENMLSGEGSGHVYVITVDVAGEDEEGVEGEELRVEQPRKDSTAVTVFRVELSTVEDPLIGFPTYEVVNRYWWTGKKHSALYSTLVDLMRQWRAWYLVVDATGVGAGLASFLARKFGKVKDGAGGLVVPFEFTSASKSDLGWNFVGLVESGRFKDYAEDGEPDTAQFWREVGACEFEVMPGPGKVLRWGVADPAVHDDMLVSAALVSVLDGMEWRVEVEGEVIPPEDALDRAFPKSWQRDKGEVFLR